MAEVRFDNAYQGETSGEKKDATYEAVASANIASTDWTQLGSDYYDVGNNTILAGTVVWTYASGTRLDIRLKYDVYGDATLWNWVPSFGAPSSGASTASIAEVRGPAATFDRNGTIADVPFVFNVPERRRFQVWYKSDNASGSLSAAVYAGKGT